MLFQRQKKKGFLHRIITGDEKWICYGNPKSKKPWVKSGEPDPAQRKRDVYCGEIVLGIQCDHQGMVNFQLLETGERISSGVYRRQLIRLKRTIQENCPEWVNRHHKLIFGRARLRSHSFYRQSSFKLPLVPVDAISPRRPAVQFS